MKAQDVEYISIDEFKLQFYLSSPTLGRRRRQFADEVLIRQAGDLIREEMRLQNKYSVANLCQTMSSAFAIH